MALEPDVLVALIFRYALIAVYLYLVAFFRRGYAQSKLEGFPNKFLLGFFFMVLMIAAIIMGMAIYETVRITIPGTPNLEAPFPGHDDANRVALVGIFNNLTRPLFVLALIASNCIIAAQVYPLELAINWKKIPVTKLLLVTGLLLFFIFIPELTFSILTQVLMWACTASLAVGFFLNIGVNIHLARMSTGALRRRSIFIVIGFICFYVGFIWALEVGWMKALVPVATLKWDVVVGSVVQMIAALFYLNGFKRETTQIATSESRKE